MRCGYGERKEKRGKIKYKVGIRSGRSKKKIEKNPAALKEESKHIT